MVLACECIDFENFIFALKIGNIILTHLGGGGGIVPSDTHQSMKHLIITEVRL